MKKLDKIYTKSILAISYVTYMTNNYATVNESNKYKDLNMFVIDNTEENKYYFFEYKRKINNRSEMMLDLTKFDDIVKSYKIMSKEFTKQKASDKDA